MFLFRTLPTLPTLILAMLVCHSAPAAGPETIVYQGTLTNSAGQPLTGAFGFTFSLYDEPEGGNVLWQEQQTLTVDFGSYSAELGSVATFPPDLFVRPLYLGVRVGTDGEMVPRARLGATPYAFTAVGLGTRERYFSPSANQTSCGAALHAILSAAGSEATSTHPVTVRIGPGTCDLQDQRILVPMFVFLNGAGPQQSTLTGHSPAEPGQSGMVTLSSSSGISGLTLLHSAATPESAENGVESVNQALVVSAVRHASVTNMVIRSEEPPGSSVRDSRVAVRVCGSTDLVIDDVEITVIGGTYAYGLRLDCMQNAPDPAGLFDLRISGVHIRIDTDGGASNAVGRGFMFNGGVVSASNLSVNLNSAATTFLSGLYVGKGLDPDQNILAHGMAFAASGDGGAVGKIVDVRDDASGRVTSVTVQVDAGSSASIEGAVVRNSSDFWLSDFTITISGGLRPRGLQWWNTESPTSVSGGFVNGRVLLFPSATTESVSALQLIDASPTLRQLSLRIDGDCAPVLVGMSVLEGAAPDSVAFEHSSIDMPCVGAGILHHADNGLAVLHSTITVGGRPMELTSPTPELGAVARIEHSTLRGAGDAVNSSQPVVGLHSVIDGAVLAATATCTFVSRSDGTPRPSDCS